MKRLSTVTMILATLTACGGAQTTSTTPGTGAGPDGKASAAGDVSFDVGPLEIKGLAFVPEALGNPDMAIVEAKKKTTIDKQRATFASTKDPVQKQAHAAILATMLFRKSQTEEGAAEKATLEDARQVLRDAAAAATAAKAEVDEITLRLLGTYELMLEDYGAAAQAWSALHAAVAAEDAAKLKKNPKAQPSKDLAAHKAWWAYALLMQYKNAEALELVKNDAVSDKTPELAYVTAWAKWRAGDDAGAWTALVAAARGGALTAQAIERDLFLLGGRVNLPLEEVKTALFELTKAKQRAQQYEVLAKLGAQAYGFAGRWNDGLTAIDQAVTIAGDTIPAVDRPRLRYTQADFATRAEDPGVVGKYAKLTFEALAACADKCEEKEKQDMIYGLYGTARLLHWCYATANDIRFHQPAHDIYQAAVEKTMDAERRAAIQKDLVNLDATLRNTKAGSGTHDKGAVTAVLERHSQEVQACYEEGLLSNPKLAGTLTVNLESDQTGDITGVTTEPAAGLGDMAAVAGCAQEHIKTWKLPKRGKPGTTRIKVSYALAPRGK